MGRTEPSIGRPPAMFRRAARAKRAKATIRVVVPAMLSAHPRAQRGIDRTELLTAKSDLPARSPSHGSGGMGDDEQSGPHLSLRVCDTLAAAHALLEETPARGGPDATPYLDLSNRRARVGILNMASPLSPGGGFLNGASSQEESLCMRTTLLPSLRDEYYRLPELSVVYTPDVLVFRENTVGGDNGPRDLDKVDRWFVDCFSAAMLRLPDTDVDESSESQGSRYRNDKDRVLVRQKMKLLLRVCQARGVRKVVLGAWGCGAYGNPVAEVAAAWREVLLGKPRRKGGKNKKGGRSNDANFVPVERWPGLEEVVFAIKDHGMARGFSQAFGSELLPLEDMEEGEDDDDEENDEADEDDEGDDDNEDGNSDGNKGEGNAVGAESELQATIQTLERRIEESRIPDMKARLEVVLNSLRAQLQK